MHEPDIIAFEQKLISKEPVSSSAELSFAKEKLHGPAGDHSDSGESLLYLMGVIA